MQLGFRLIFMLMLLGSSLGLRGQEVPLQDRLTEHLDTLSQRVPANLLYIQTSKGIYEKGEDLWFKCYELDAQLLSPSDKSTTLYVQLISDKDQSPVWQEKYPIINGFSEGHIYLNDSLIAGSYYLLAYSEFATSIEDKETSGVRKIEIAENIRSYKNTLKKEALQEEVSDFQLFPVGGTLVENLPNKVAFKATNTNGRPVSVMGTLFKNNTKILDFQSEHDGMGSFVFKPTDSDKYEVKLIAGQKKHTYPVQKSQKEGVTFNLSQVSREQLTIRIFKSKKYQNQKLFFRIQMRGVVYAIASIEPSIVSKLKIPLQDLPKGIAECTIFNEYYQPIAERLVFINDHKSLQIDSKLKPQKVKQGFSKREKVTISIAVSDSDNKPVIGNFGISVYDNIYNNERDPKTITSHFYLSTQLKGAIHNPSYYFEDKNKDRLVHLELLLLTQGWRRYAWNEDNLRQLRPNLKPLVFNDIKGSISLANKKKKNSSYPTLVSFDPEKNRIGNFIEVDSIGQFNIASTNLKQGGYLHLKYFPENEQRFTFQFADAFKSLTKTQQLDSLFYPTTSAEAGTTWADYQKRSDFDMIRLNEVVVKAKSKAITRGKYLGKLDSLAKLEYGTDYVCQYNMLNCPIHVIDKKNRKPVEGEVYMELLVWDGDAFVPGSDKSKGFINPPLPPYRYPTYTDEDLLELYHIIRTKSYYAEREFYQPVHDQFNDPLPDHRNTLLWAPSVITDENGKAELSFFCSDVDATFIIEIEGVGGSGLLGSKRMEFFVAE